MYTFLRAELNHSAKGEAMVIKRKELPDVGELVVGTVKEVYDYGAYLTLDEYGGLEAYLPWSEVASRWIRSIEEAVKPGQKVVVKVIRVNKHRKQVDVSLKRVTESEKRKKFMLWKRAQKAEKILEIVAQRLGKSLKEAYEEAGWKIEDYYGEIMAGLEQAVLEGAEALMKAGVPPEWAKALYEEAKRHIEVKRAKITGTLTLKTLEPDGVERIRKILLEIKNTVEKTPNVKAILYTVGAPRYRVEVEANDYKTAEKALAEGLEMAKKLARTLNVELSFSRDKR